MPVRNIRFPVIKSMTFFGFPSKERCNVVMIKFLALTKHWIMILRSQEHTFYFQAPFLLHSLRTTDEKNLLTVCWSESSPSDNIYMNTYRFKSIIVCTSLITDGRIYLRAHLPTLLPVIHKWSIILIDFVQWHGTYSLCPYLDITYIIADVMFTCVVVFHRLSCHVAHI